MFEFYMAGVDLKEDMILAFHSIISDHFTTEGSVTLFDVSVLLEIESLSSLIPLLSLLLGHEKHQTTGSVPCRVYLMFQIGRCTG